MSFSPEATPTPESPNHLSELSTADLAEARKAAEDMKHDFGTALRSQAKSMESFSGVELKPEEVRLYCALRDQVSPAMGGRPAGMEESGKRASSLSDQRVMAAVLLASGDQERLKKFTSAYPNIFNGRQGV